MVFTLEDAENDGLVKREVGRELSKVAQRKNNRLFSKFKQVADKRGLDPAEILGDRVVRMLNDPDYAERIANVTVDVSELEKQNIRMKDVEMVQQLTEELGINEDDNDDIIDNVVKNRLEMSTQSPLSAVHEGIAGKDDKDKAEMAEKIESLERKIEMMASESGGSNTTGTGNSREEASQDIDDLFDSGGGESDTSNSSAPESVGRSSEGGVEDE